MITVKYELYTNDFIREYLEKNFANLSEVRNWLLDEAFSYDDAYFANPEWIEKDYCGGKKLELSHTISIFTHRKNHIWIHLMTNDAGIIFSDGKYTNKISHWNEDVKQWFRNCNEYKKQNKFNFV